MNQSLILNSISKNGKINHFCLTEKWYINKKLENIYKLIFAETSFLDKYNVSLRERIFYIEKNGKKTTPKNFNENHFGVMNFVRSILKSKVSK